MPVSTQGDYLRNTTGGAYTAQTQGGTVLGNTTTSTDRISKALSLLDNGAPFTSTLPSHRANGLVGNHKPLSAGTFAYEAAGQYVIASISATLSGVAKTNILITSRATESAQPIAKFRHDFGADTTSLMRKNRFSRVGYFNNGNKVVSRRLWLNAAGTAVAAPSTLTTTNMWDLADGNATNIAFDSAAEPTRAIPGELVMKADFVTLNVTLAAAGDFFDYKPITGM
tara:strand:- start:135 stop:812 length:678 start_codon:yes stop_codon:yes gene_type:complete